MGDTEDDSSLLDDALAAVAADPDNDFYQLTLSDAALDAGDWQTALAAADAAIRLAPADPAHHEARAYALLVRGGDPGSALDAARAAVRLGPDRASAHQVLSAAARQAGVRHVAEAAARQARTLAPDADTEAIALNNIAVANLRKERWVKAMRGLHAAAVTSPDASPARRNLDVAIGRFLDNAYMAILMFGLGADLFAWHVATKHVGTTGRPIDAAGRARWLDGTYSLMLAALPVFALGTLARLGRDLRRYVLRFVVRDSHAHARVAVIAAVPCVAVAGPLSGVAPFATSAMVATAVPVVWSLFGLMRPRRR